MSIIFNQPTVPASNSGRRPFNGLSAPQGQDRPKAKLWLNVGYEANGKFINLPIGLPVDTMEPADIRGQNEDWVKQRTAQNALLEALQKAGMSMQPGQESTLKLEVRMRRVNETLVVESGDNEYGIDLGNLFVTPVAPTVEAPKELELAE